jgi:hypothetical protein
MLEERGSVRGEEGQCEEESVPSERSQKITINMEERVLRKG